MSYRDWQPPRGNQAMQPQAPEEAMQPDGSYTNRSFRSSNEDLNHGRGQANNPSQYEEELVFSSITQQHPMPRDRPVNRTPRQRLPESLGGNRPEEVDTQTERLESIAVPLSIGSLMVGAPCCSVPSVISAWGCLCCEPQEKRRRSLFAILCAALALCGGMILIIGAIAGWTNREILIEMYVNSTLEAHNASTTAAPTTALETTTVSNSSTTANNTMTTTISSVPTTAGS